jgi:uncharacterized protein
MRFAQERLPNTHVVSRYAADGLWVGSEHYTQSVIVTATAVTPWSARRVADLSTNDIDAVLALEPELILLATGTTQQFPAAALLYHALMRRVGIEVMTIGGAARTYNVLVGDGRRVALAAVIAPPLNVSADT